MKSVYYNNEEYQQLLKKFDDLVQQMEDSPFPQVKELLTPILQYFDLIHREPLARLFKMIEEDHPGWKTHLESDYAIKTLFTLYDLLDGEIERNPLDHPNTKGFVPESQVGLLTPIEKRE